MDFIICILLAGIFAVLLHIALCINEFLKSNERKSVRKHEQLQEDLPRFNYIICDKCKSWRKPNIPICPNCKSE